MSLINSFASLAKAGIAAALTPVAVVADVVRLPVTGYDGKPPFGLTGALLNAAGRNVANAVQPDEERADR